MNNKVCLLGATGFIGSAISEKLNQNNIDWIGLSRKNSTDPRIVEVDFTNPRSIIEIIDAYPNVINAMGSNKPRDFEENPEFVLNSFWNDLDNISAILNASNVKKLLNISSGGTVYGEYTGRPSKESDPLKPKSWYGRSKVLEELRFEQLAHKNNFTYICARVTNPFGNKSFTKHGFIDVLANSVLNDLDFNTYQADCYYRDFIHSSDMANIIIELLNVDYIDTVNVFNVGSGISTNLIELAEDTKKMYPNLKLKRNYLANKYEVIHSEVCIKKTRMISQKIHKLLSIEEYIKGI